jgi:hypothetical protein
MGGITRKMINDNIARFQHEFSADRVEDITDDGLKRKFVKMFGEDKPVVEAPHEPAPAVDKTSE